MPESAPLDPRNTYAATKAHGEQLATIWSRETGGTVAALRFHNVYGPGMPRNTPYAGVASIFADSLLRGENRRESLRMAVSDATSSMSPTWQRPSLAAFSAPLAGAADAAEYRDTVGNDSR